MSRYSQSYTENRNLVTAALTAEDTWTQPLGPIAPVDHVGISVAGTFSALVSVERSFDRGATWQLVPLPDGSDGWTGPTEQAYLADAGCLLRIGVPAGQYTSGTVMVALRVG